MTSGPQKDSLSDKLRRIAGATQPRWYSPTALVLIAANLLPLYGVLILGWAVLPIMVLFWLENIVIGVLNILRILFASPADASRRVSKFFWFRSSLSTMACLPPHTACLCLPFSAVNPTRHSVDGLWTIDAARRAITEFSLWPGIGALAASHLFSFFWNYLGQREYQQARPEALMQAPYGRIMVLHVTIILGGLLIQLFHSPLWALLLLIGLKIGVDLRAHLKEHRRRKLRRTRPRRPDHLLLFYCVPLLDKVRQYWCADVLQSMAEYTAGDQHGRRARHLRAGNAAQQVDKVVPLAIAKMHDKGAFALRRHIACDKRVGGIHQWNTLDIDVGQAELRHDVVDVVVQRRVRRRARRCGHTHAPRRCQSRNRS